MGEQQEALRIARCVKVPCRTLPPKLWGGKGWGEVLSGMTPPNFKNLLMKKRILICG